MSALGMLRERVTLQAESRSADTGGGASLSWNDVATLWAAVEPLRGMEKAEGEQTRYIQSYRVTVRADSSLSIAAAQRLIWRSKILNIRSVRDVGARQRYIEITAEEGGTT